MSLVPLPNHQSVEQFDQLEKGKRRHTFSLPQFILCCVTNCAGTTFRFLSPLHRKRVEWEIGKSSTRFSVLPPSRPFPSVPFFCAPPAGTRFRPRMVLAACRVRVACVRNSDSSCPLGCSPIIPTFLSSVPSVMRSYDTFAYAFVFRIIQERALICVARSVNE